MFLKNPFPVVFALLGFLLPVLSLAQDATEIVRQADLLLRGNSSKSEIVMDIIRPSWTRSMGITSWSKGDDLALILINSPAREKGTVFLKRGKEIWNWLPAIERTIKLPPSMMAQSWMGSDFTNDDLVRESSVVEDYFHKIVGDTTVLGYPCYKIELLPKPDAAVLWERVVVYISKEGSMQLLAYFYDEAKEPVSIWQAKQTGILAGKKIPTIVEMLPTDKPGHKTIITWKSLELDLPLEDGFFSQQNMRRVK